MPSLDPSRPPAEPGPARPSESAQSSESAQPAQPAQPAPAVSGQRARRGGRHWLGIFTLIWVLVLAAAAVIGVFHGRPTAREQTTVAQALPVLARSTSELAAAAAADSQAVVALQGIERYDCSVTTFRPGARYQRGVLALVDPGTEADLLQRVARRLPGFFQARVFAGDNPSLSADAGFYVAVSGTIVGPGEVRLVSDTGDCRVEGDVSLDESPHLGDPAAVDAALAGLSLPIVQEHRTYVIDCPSGDGQMETVEAIGDAPAGGVSAEKLRSLARGDVVGASDEMVAYRTSDFDLAVRLDRDQAIATSTRGTCQ